MNAVCTVGPHLREVPDNKEITFVQVMRAKDGKELYECVGRGRSWIDLITLSVRD